MKLNKRRMWVHYGPKRMLVNYRPIRMLVNYGLKRMWVHTLWDREDVGTQRKYVGPLWDRKVHYGTKGGGRLAMSQGVRFVH